MDGDLAERVTAAVGVETVEFRSPKGEGYTNNERRLVRLADGGTAFVKAAVDDLTAEWLRDEWRVYAVVRAPFLPALLGWHDDGERPVLVLEDLSAAYWPPPWSSEHVASLLAALEMVAKSSPPAGLPSLESMRTELAGWELVADDREPFLSLGPRRAGWMRRSLRFWPPRRRACSPGRTSFTSMSGATTFASSASAQSSSTGTGPSSEIPKSTWRRGFRVFMQKEDLHPRRSSRTNPRPPR
jgi:hypothetical protein